jgi:hypothetical protein
MTFTISTTNNAAGSVTLCVTEGRLASNTRPPSEMPAFIQADEAYYWSSPWQRDAREAMAARAAGESAVFDSDDPDDVVRWLLSVDDGDVD